MKDGKTLRIPRRRQISQAKKAGIDYRIAERDLPLCALQPLSAIRQETEQLSLL